MCIRDRYQRRVRGGRDKVWLDPTKFSVIKEARTNEQLRLLIQDGIVLRKTGFGHQMTKLSTSQVYRWNFIKGKPKTFESTIATKSVKRALEAAKQKSQQASAQTSEQTPVVADMRE
eukprot:TRINITY_DN1167_c0_g1_i1.p1 TRINITY_DN1167_c0_g1~~TRINITY_DN1167_c0_g1_i1.p1  ORF type:complete len:117 (+),score=40.45 TRINITY_DN1167_c0_g1_i1:3-353(+)